MIKMKGDKYRFLAFCGVIAPIIFTVVLLILGVLQPEYNHIKQYISEFGAVDAPYALIFNTIGFPILGILIIAFAFALNKGINNGKGTKIGPILLVVSGCSFVLVSIFPCDPGCIPISTVGIIHGYMCLIALLALILAPFFMLHRLVRDDKWHNYHIYSIVIAIIALSVVIVGKSGFFMESIGLLQRLAYGLSLLWVEIMAIKLLRVSEKRY